MYREFECGWRGNDILFFIAFAMKRSMRGRCHGDEANEMSTLSLKSQAVSPEDIFYDNLTLGLTKVLNSIPRIANITCEKRQPCEKAQINAWEQRHNVYLPGNPWKKK